MAKDLDGSISGILTFSDDKNNFYRYLQKIEHLEPLEKKQNSLPSPSHQINKIKKNIIESLQKNPDQIIFYLPSTIFEIENLNPFNNKIDIIKIHSNTVKNEIKAQVFVLNEAFFRGNMYHILRTKL
jgi:hypothetical protein